METLCISSLKWLFLCFRLVEIIPNSSSLFQHGVGVEFVRVLGETQTPALSNMFCECAPNDDVVSLAQNYITIILLIVGLL